VRDEQPRHEPEAAPTDDTIRRVLGDGIRETEFVEDKVVLRLSPPGRQAEFVRDCIRMANSAFRARHSGYLVIGREASEAFRAVNERLTDNDIYQVFEARIGPDVRVGVRRLEVDNEPLLVLIFDHRVLNGPFLVKSNYSDGEKTLLREGESWIGYGPRKKRVSRADLDAMYDRRIEVETERRLRVRAELAAREADVRVGVPNIEVLLSPPDIFLRHLEGYLTQDNATASRFLVERLRDLTVLEWRRDRTAAENGRYDEIDIEHLKDVLRPGLVRIALVALSCVKYGEQGELFRWSVDLIRAIYDLAVRAPAGFFDRPHDGDENSWYLSRHMVAYESVLAARS
jgi:hypothetical protein